MTPTQMLSNKGGKWTNTATSVIIQFYSTSVLQLSQHTQTTITRIRRPAHSHKRLSNREKQARIFSRGILFTSEQECFRGIQMAEA